MRSGPLGADSRDGDPGHRRQLVTVAVRHRYGRGAPRLPDRADRRRAASARCWSMSATRSRPGSCWPRWTRWTSTNVLAALEASIARGGSAIAAAQAQRRDAQARSELAGIKARRYVDLGEQKFISAGAVEAQAAGAGLGRRRRGRRRREPGRRAAGHRSAWRPSARACAQQRDNVRLLAPADGVVISRDAEAGSTVVAGQAVLRLIEPASLWIRVRLDQGRSAGLGAGLPARSCCARNPSEPSVRQGGSGGGHERQRHRGTAGPGGLRHACPPACPSANWPRSRWHCRPRPPAWCAQRRHSTPGRRKSACGASTAASSASPPVRLGQTSLDGQVQILDGLKAGDEVVVYSEKALTAGSRIKVVERSAGSAP